MHTDPTFVLMHPFRQYIHNYTQLTEATWHEVEAALVEKKLAAGEHILKAGEICKHLHFLESGLMRYYILHEGEEQTKFFTIAPYLFTSQASYVREQASKEYIQCVEAAKVYSLSKVAEQDLSTRPDWREFSVLIKEEVQGYTEDILEAFHTQTPRERYAAMLQNSNHWVHRIPLKYVASFLGIAAPSLSRIRKQVLGGN